MARQNIDRTLQEQLVKAVHAYNEKIRYHSKNDQIRQALPERERARDLKKQLTTRTDYKREINRLRRFGSADVTETVTIGKYDNIQITKYEKQEIQRQVQNINRRRARKLEKIQAQEVQAAGKPTGYKRGEMPSFREADLKPKKVNLSKIGSRRELERYKDTLEYQRMNRFFEQRAEKFKQNYIKALRQQFGKTAADPLIKQISEMNAKAVEEKYYSEQDATIEYVYLLHKSKKGGNVREQMKLDNLYIIWGVEQQPDDSIIEI